MHAPPDDILWVSEARMLSICDVRRSTFRSWTNAAVISLAPGNAYGEGSVLELALVNAVRDHFSLGELAIRWRRLGNEGALEHFISRARLLDAGERFDLVVETQLGGISLASDDSELASTVRFEDAPRAVIVLPLAGRVMAIRKAFRDIALSGRRPVERKVGRPKRADGLQSAERT